MSRSGQQKYIYMREKRRGIGFETVAGMGGGLSQNTRQHETCAKAASPAVTLRHLPPPPPHPPFLPQVYQSVHDAFVRLETRGVHVYHRRKEDTEQEGLEHAPLTKASFHSEPPRAHPVVEPHACSHAIVKLTNDRDNILWHAKTGKYCPEEGYINRVVSFGKADTAYY